MRSLPTLGPSVALSLLLMTAGLSQGCATGTSAGPQTMAEFGDAFACNEWFDRNQDGRVTADEFEGVKFTFSYFEELAFVALYETGVGTQITWSLFGPERTLVRRGTAVGRWDRGYRMVRFMVGDLIDRNGLGEYRMEWYLEGTPTKMTRVRLTR